MFEHFTEEENFILNLHTHVLIEFPFLIFCSNSNTRLLHQVTYSKVVGKKGLEDTPSQVHSIFRPNHGLETNITTSYIDLRKNRRIIKNMTKILSISFVGKPKLSPIK